VTAKKGVRRDARGKGSSKQFEVLSRSAATVQVFNTGTSRRTYGLKRKGRNEKCWDEKPGAPREAEDAGSGQKGDALIDCNGGGKKRQRKEGQSFQKGLGGGGEGGIAETI